MKIGQDIIDFIHKHNLEDQMMLLKVKDVYMNVGDFSITFGTGRDSYEENQIIVIEGDGIAF